MDTAPRLPRGRLCVGDTAFPIQSPPLRSTSFHRKEGASKQAPSLGRGRRAQRGGVGFLFLAAKPPPLCLPHCERRCVEKSGILVSLPSLLGKRDRVAVDRVLSYIVDLRRISPLFFIPLEPYPARSARHLPHAGKALSVGIVFPHMRVFVLTMREKRYSRFAAFPIGEGGPRSGG